MPSYADHLVDQLLSSSNEMENEVEYLDGCLTGDELKALQHSANLMHYAVSCHHLIPLLHDAFDAFVSVNLLDVHAWGNSSKMCAQLNGRGEKGNENIINVLMSLHKVSDGLWNIMHNTSPTDFHFYVDIRDLYTNMQSIKDGDFERFHPALKVMFRELLNGDKLHKCIVVFASFYGIPMWVKGQVEDIPTVYEQLSNKGWVKQCKYMP